MTPQEYDKLPENIKEILFCFDDSNPDLYDECRRTISLLNKAGWTAEYDLSGGIYDVKQINE